MPWERNRLTPVEIDELYEGLRWRRSRDMELLTTVLVWMRSGQGAESDYDQILESMPGYDRDYFKEIDAMRDRALNKMRKKAKAKRA